MHISLTYCFQHTLTFILKCNDILLFKKDLIEVRVMPQIQLTAKITRLDNCNDFRKVEDSLQFLFTGT